MVDQVLKGIAQLQIMGHEIINKVIHTILVVTKVITSKQKEVVDFNTIVVQDLMLQIQVVEFLENQNLISILVLSIPMRFQLVKFATKKIMLLHTVFKGITIQSLAPQFNVKFAGSLDI